MSDRQYYIYILASISNSVVYVGMTNDLLRRIEEHRIGAVDGFTKKYRCHKLVYYEVFATAYEAISREKQLKAGSRKKKDTRIAALNPTWKDLVEDLA